MPQNQIIPNKIRHTSVSIRLDVRARIEPGRPSRGLTAFGVDINTGFGWIGCFDHDARPDRVRNAAFITVLLLFGNVELRTGPQVMIASSLFRYVFPG